MTEPHIHGRWRSFSVSNAVNALGKRLSAIKDEDGLTWKDVGRILGKSDDRASDYATGISEMPVGAFLLACREWNGRFANVALGMVGQKLAPVDGREMPDKDKLTRLLALSHALAAALADDGEVDDDELRVIGPGVLDDAARGVDALRDRLHQLRQQDNDVIELRRTGAR